MDRHSTASCRVACPRLKTFIHSGGIAVANALAYVALFLRKKRRRKRVKDGGDIDGDDEK